MAISVARVEPHRVAQHHRVEPAGTAAATGVGAELVAALDELVADRVAVEQLGGERAAADARDVGLGDADDARRSRSGPTPAPVHTPPAIGFDDVTNGYVPWSRSRNVACAPSNSTGRPASSASCTRCTVSSIIGSRRGTMARYCSADLVGVERQPVVDLGQHAVLLAQREVELLRGRSWRRAGPARAGRRAAPCRRRRGRCRAWWCRACSCPGSAR